MVDGCMTSMNKLSVLVFAGPNGSGKSTITYCYYLDGLYINADEIKAKRQCTDIEAALEAERLREDCLRSKMSFTFETVLSTHRNIELLIRAKQSGYSIRSVVVITSDPEINVFRVKSRVHDGGHDVPIDKIRNRYHKSLQNIRELVALSDECRIYDNTKTPQIIYFKSEHGQVIYENVYWSQEKIEQFL